MTIGFPTYGLLCPFCFFLLGIIGPFAPFGLPHPFLLTLHSHGLLLTSLGFPGPITSFSSLGFMALLLTPYILLMGMLFLSCWASLSPFTSSMPIFLFHEPVIHHSCRLGLMVLPPVCQPFAAFVAGLSAFHLDPKKWPSTTCHNSIG